MPLITGLVSTEQCAALKSRATRELGLTLGGCCCLPLEASYLRTITLQSSRSCQEQVETHTDDNKLHATEVVAGAENRKALEHARIPTVSDRLQAYLEAVTNFLDSEESESQ